jgi:PTS system mannose-specific IIB component
MICLSRVDSRLIHGQIVEAWIPHLQIERIALVDDAVVEDTFAKAAMALAIPPSAQFWVWTVDSAPFDTLQTDAIRTLVLFRDISSALRAFERGLQGPLNLGNVHAGPKRESVSRTVFLTDDERAQLIALGKAGHPVIIQPIPTDAPTAV